MSTTRNENLTKQKTIEAENNWKPLKLLNLTANGSCLWWSKVRAWGLCAQKGRRRKKREEEKERSNRIKVQRKKRKPKRKSTREIGRSIEREREREIRNRGSRKSYYY